MKPNTQTKSGNSPAAAAPAATSATGTSVGAIATATADSGKPPEGGEADKPADPPVDPFADLPTIRLHEAEIQDLSGVATSNPRKYEKVAAEATAEHLPVVKGWKYETAVFVQGTNRAERKPSSVHGTVAAIAAAAGKQGINAYEMAALVRKRQIGNKRSHYCDSLPPVGWAEGWINSAVTRGILAVHPTRKAPALRPTQVAAAGTEATAQQNAEAKATGTNG